MERTYVMLKPDAVRRKLTGRIIDRIEAKGYRVVELKIMTLEKEILREHYAHVANEPFYPAMEGYMTSGPVWAMIVEGENVIQGVRILMGATKFENAVPGTIRGDFASSTTENLIHGSDSPENAEIEIKRFFG
ncbi:nucleoside-diphosphate kinase [Clostridium aminobutyricum]|uniref:Nucleoside diphosphate kinase n=1 Tax=Clostridium aminobutyricum TaxID=33953 RepID=A0A939D7D2_CLOAM|nr:nucleoside-diphosphate kinase [Clostridium aminobutyricum]MBN7772789.1 nucleoside-diphosphate kinase [Clostridium aminobutyricum]